MLEALTFAFFLELGYLPSNSLTVYNPPARVDYEHTFYADLGYELSYADLFYIGGGFKVYSWPISLGSYFPFFIDCRFNCGIRFSIFDIGYRHQCSHPVIPYFSLDQANSIHLDASYDELFIRISGQIN